MRAFFKRSFNLLTKCLENVLKGSGGFFDFVCFLEDPLRPDLAEDTRDEEDKCADEEKRLEAFLEGVAMGTNSAFAEREPMLKKQKRET